VNPILRAWANARNAADFALRNALTWSPPARERAEAKDEPDAAEKRWLETYRLAESRDRMTEARWQRNVAALEVLMATRENDVVKTLLRDRPTLRALDIGSKNFDYVDALCGFWSHQNGERSVTLTGLELDAHRRYTDFRTRRAWAEHYASFVPGAHYQAGNLLAHTECYDAITWFYPFVTEFPLLRWGLPLAEFQPLALLEHAFSLLEPGGVLVIVNQSEAESHVQRAFLATLGRSYTVAGPREKPITLVETPVHNRSNLN